MKKAPLIILFKKIIKNIEKATTPTSSNNNVPPSLIIVDKFNFNPYKIIAKRSSFLEENSIPVTYLVGYPRKCLYKIAVMIAIASAPTLFKIGKFDNNMLATATTSVKPTPRKNALFNLILTVFTSHTFYDENDYL